MTKQERAVFDKFAKQDTEFGEAIEDALYRLDQDAITEKAFKSLPKAVRKFYEAGRRENGTFDWLECKMCEQRRSNGHDDECPVLELEPKDVTYDEYDETED